MIKHLLLAIAITFSAPFGFAQKNKKGEAAETKSADNSEIMKEVEALVLKGINDMRTAANMDSLERNEILEKTSASQADFMASIGKAQLVQDNKKMSTTGLRLQAFGGTQKAQELVIMMPAVKGKNTFTAQQIAEGILKKWQTSKKEKPIILGNNNVYIGVSARLSADSKKSLVSAVFGGFDSFNMGASKRKELAVRYTKKNKKLLPPTEKGCVNCDKFKDFRALQSGLYLKKNKVYLRYEDLKALKKLLAKQYDGFAVDIVQRAQYEKPEYNIYDNNLFSKGVLLKRVYSGKIYKKNLALKDKEVKNPNYLDVCLGKFPKKLKGDYEMNLLVLQNNQVCRTVTPSYLEQGDQESSTPLTMLLMPDSNLYLNPPYKPVAEKKTLNFVIPFDKNKSEFKPEDIKPFLEALQEPDFIIDTLSISAYSSIEGDSVSNAQLQRKRAESIVKTLEKMQTKKINTKVKTSDSWDLFRISMEGTPYERLTNLPKNEATKEINTTRGLADSLEPYLAKQRFAQIKMEVTYDIAGAKEEKYAVAQFNKAVKQGDDKQALKIQYFIEDNVKKRKYSEAALTKLNIPQEAANSGILMNTIVYNYMKNGSQADEADWAQLRELAKLDPENKYVAYNNMYCFMKMGNFDHTKMNETQRQITDLYGTVPKKNVDALNAEYQFMVMDAVDTLPDSEPIIQACVDKIKSFYNFKESSWENSLKLAYVFTKFKDYKFAANLLEPYIDKQKVDEQLLFTYISLCPQLPEKLNSRAFVTAMKKAKQANPERYGKLIGQPFLTFQVLGNPIIKAEYLKN